jgi:hypothetical protein
MRAERSPSTPWAARHPPPPASPEIAALAVLTRCLPSAPERFSIRRPEPAPRKGSARDLAEGPLEDLHRGVAAPGRTGPTFGMDRSTPGGCAERDRATRSSGPDATPGAGQPRTTYQRRSERDKPRERQQRFCLTAKPVGTRSPIPDGANPREQRSLTTG